MICAVALVAATATAAFAQDVATLDTDGDKMVSLAELNVSYPDITEEQFTAMDTSGDGLLDDAELTAAVEAGTLTQ
jgi:hypothetical protein